MTTFVQVLCCQSINTLNAMKHPLLKISAAKKSLALLRYAKELGHTASTLRQFASVRYGDKGEPNPRPISGGLCDHWPQVVKDEIAVVCRQWSAALDESHRLWKSASKHHQTWMRAKESILGTGISYPA